MKISSVLSAGFICLAQLIWAQDQDSTQNLDQDTTRISFIAVGDMMIGLNYPNANDLPEKDGAMMFADVKDVLQSADVTFGNLEGVLLDNGGEPKKCAPGSSCWTFRSPTRYIKHYQDAGFDLLSVANNHSNDFGETGRKSTYNVLKNSGIGFAGFKDLCPYTIIEKKGLKIGFAAFSQAPTTIQNADTKKVQETIKYLKENSDIVVVSTHMGGEGKGFSHISRRQETGHGGLAGRPYDFFRMAVDAGADMVFGSHPHVPRAIDIYKGKFMAYSLGNFATAKNFGINGVNGYAPIIKIWTDRQGNFIEGQIYSFIQSGRAGNRRPHKDNTGACIKEIKKLTEADLPETKIKIQNDGKIIKK